MKQSGDIGVLLVEDDALIRESTQLALERYGFRVATAADGLSGLEAFRHERPDVAVLDIMMPLMDGISLCRRIREESALPVLLLSARGEPVDVVQGLESGADDYLTKPFDISVLVARIRTVLRRSAAEVPDPSVAAAPDGPMEFGDLLVDPAALEVHRAGTPLTLTPTELRLLLELAGSAGRVLSRDILLQRVWGYPVGGDTRVVDVHVQRLRAKVGKDRISTVRGFGYKLTS